MRGSPFRSVFVGVLAVALLSACTAKASTSSTPSAVPAALTSSAGPTSPVVTVPPVTEPPSSSAPVASSAPAASTPVLTPTTTVKPAPPKVIPAAGYSGDPKLGSTGLVPAEPDRHPVHQRDAGRRSPDQPRRHRGEGHAQPGQEELDRRRTAGLRHHLHAVRQGRRRQRQGRRTQGQLQHREPGRRDQREHLPRRRRHRRHRSADHDQPGHRHRRHHRPAEHREGHHRHHRPEDRGFLRLDPARRRLGPGLAAEELLGARHQGQGHRQPVRGQLRQQPLGQGGHHLVVHHRPRPRSPRATSAPTDSRSTATASCCSTSPPRSAWRATRAG